MAVAAFSTLVASLGGATASGRGLGASAEVNTSRPVLPAPNGGATGGVTALAAADASGGATLGSGSNPASAGGSSGNSVGNAADSSGEDAALLREAESLLTQISRAADDGGQIGQLRGRVEDYLAALRPVAAAELAARARTMLVLLGTAAASQEAAPAAVGTAPASAAEAGTSTVSEAGTGALTEALTGASLRPPDTGGDTGSAPRPGSTDLSGLLTLPGVLPAPGQAIRLPAGGETGRAPDTTGLRPASAGLPGASLPDASLPGAAQSGAGQSGASRSSTHLPGTSLSGTSLSGSGLLQSLAALAPVALPSVDYRA